MESPGATEPSPRVRRAIRIRGTVQGVGFRPAVHRVATALSLGGFVRNDAEGLWTEVEGDREAVELFLQRLSREVPALARIDSVEAVPRPVAGESSFRIVTSALEGLSRAAIPADTAPCADCLRELFDPLNRRQRYPFINCTACGPRYTIVLDVPYDRARTTMQSFVLCAACREEYENPADRRFHAEPNACARCGPQVELIAPNNAPLNADAALLEAARRIAAGEIVAVKGVGGYLLATNAQDKSAVARLRERKHRPHKPFAVMVRDLETARCIAVLSDAAERQLLSAERPIVLVPRRTEAPLADNVAPGLAEVGIFLPPTPLQHLLLTDGPALQVMTSGNRSDEPIARDEAEAFSQLDGIAEAFLIHNRPIHTRADDSVIRIVAGESRAIRRARGLVPEGIELGFEAPPLLAVGAELKSTICVTRGSEAFLSQHLGDLGNLESLAFFEETVTKLSRLLRVAPEFVAHDLHPDYRSTHWAQSSGFKRIAIQHHHAHIASCLAEHGVTGPVLGVAFDGTGCGPDGSLWGGEFLRADLLEFQRLGHLRGLPLPGGEAAIREPWRLAVAALHSAGESFELLARIESRKLEAIRHLIEHRMASPTSTGAGRWFDAVAALCGIRDSISYEAQAAIELEAICTDPERPYEVALQESLGGPIVLDLVPCVRQVVRDLQDGTPTGLIAARFHEAVARGIAATCQRLRAQTRLRTVALSGGCFQNRRLAERAKELLEDVDFTVLLNRRVPANDGGLSLGQAAIAAFRLSTGKKE